MKVFLCRGVDSEDGGFSATSIWRAHFRSIFVLSKGLLQILVNVKVNKYHCFGKCKTSLIPRVPILGFLLRFLLIFGFLASICGDEEIVLLSFCTPWCCSTGVSHIFILHHSFV